MKSTAWLIAVILVVGPYLVACEDEDEKYKNVSNVRSKVVQYQKDAEQKKKKKSGGRLSKIKKSAQDE